jgi:DNA phosphorothioation-dependent restriction protein DptG
VYLDYIKIELSERTRKIVEEVARRRSTEYRLVVRVLLMLAMADGVGNNRLALHRLIDLGVSRNIAFDKQTTQ